MDILPELMGRRARRAISGESPEGESVRRLLEACVLAPSCFNNQPSHVIVVEKRADGPEYAAVAAALTPGNAWALEAPLLIVLATGPHLDCRMDSGRDYSFFDLGQVAMALQLQAQREGLYAHPMAGFSPSKLRDALRIPKEIVPLCVIAVGKPGAPSRLTEGQRKDEDSPRSRKPLGEVVFRDSFGAAWD